MRKRFNLFLYSKCPKLYYKLRQARIWFYGFQEDYGRKYDALNEPANFNNRKPQPEAPEKKHDLHDFVGFEEVFPLD